MIDSLCAVGFSGHRDLPDSKIVEREVARLLDEIGRKTTRRLVGVCSVAIGADVIFIEACLKRKLPWIAILPMAPEVFFNKKDFPDEASRKNAMRLLETAASVEITNPARDHLMRDEREYRSVAFSDSGRRIVDYCDVFIGALRPPRDPLKPGGTGDITQYAKLCHRPSAIINPDTGAMEHQRWHAPFGSAFMDELSSLPEAPVRKDLLTVESSDERRTVVDFFGRLTTAAGRHVPRFRNVSSMAAILNGALAVLTLALALLPDWFNGLHGQIAHAINAVLSVCAAATTGWFILRKPRERAARYRLGAEICRSVIATWSLPETCREIFRGLPPDYRELVRTLLNLRRLEGPSLADLAANQERGVDSWRNHTTHYLNERVKKQLNYYEREQRKADRRLHIFNPLIAIFGLGNFFIEIAARVKGHPLIGDDGEHVVAFFKVAFPAVTATLLAILAVREANWRKGRYGEMVQVLKENAERLISPPHQRAAFDVVVDTERTLLAENIEWANTARYQATT
jgi:hypothetical protein